MSTVRTSKFGLHQIAKKAAAFSGEGIELFLSRVVLETVAQDQVYPVELREQAAERLNQLNQVRKPQ